MPTWFFYALAAPMIWAVINHIDKYVISRYAENKKPEALVIFSALVSGLVALLIFCFSSIEYISFLQALWAMFAGFLLIISYIPYMYALQKDEVSTVGPLWQMIAPISYTLGLIFLHESLSGRQIFAGILIIVGAVLMTLNFEKLIWKGKIFRLMLFSSILIALNSLIFKIIGLESSFWTVAFWESLGAFVCGVFLLCIPLYRRDFRNFLREGGQKIVVLNIVSESMNIIGRLLFNFAILIGPIALVYVVSGMQPFFIFLYGLFLFIFFPKIQSENFSRKALIVKISAICIMILGSTLLFLG